eukprot:CAMPEP_0198501474 /NCGR_PEP_ID=MMETSP1462-20131121/8734_1 /TAXON_ID=1333877 /ORGANISM="Brandtodinium nutriculum, Strain RCC3387" /LENGTH=51 /DNA_ID=CAMNT_0044230517 /DNA_START=148 /DNA_END=300 /DNA_ORIENTATION=+
MACSRTIRRKRIERANAARGALNESGEASPAIVGSSVRPEEEMHGRVQDRP